MLIAKSRKKYKRRGSADNPFVVRDKRMKDGKIGPVYRFGWAEEVYMPEAGIRETVGREFNISKLPFIGILLAFLFLILLAKITWLQIIRGAYYYSMAEGNRIRLERIEPKRGIIYDRNFTPLVRNKANFLLYFVPVDLPTDKKQLNKIISTVSGIIGDISIGEIKDKVDSIKPRSLESYHPLFITDNIAYKSALQLYLKSVNWPGVVLSSKTRREYPTVAPLSELSVSGSGLSVAHILGYTGKINAEELEKFGEEYLPIDYIGKMGIEYFWENELRGRSGRRQIEVDAMGKKKKIIGQVGAEDGHNLVLSLDILQQNKLEEILSEHLRKFKLNRCAAIVMDPNNGEILALVSLPSYNSNDFAKGISRNKYNALIKRVDSPLFNRSISGEYPSGSTIKPIIAAAALEENIISEYTTVLSTGGLKIGQWFFPDWLAGGHGRVDVGRAIAQSVNTFFYYIGGGYGDFPGLGPDRIAKYGALFGLGAQTGIDLPGEADGLLPTPKWKKETKGERWYIGDTYHLSIGQGDVLVTPLQVAVFTAVFANGGKLYRPHLVKRILSADDELISEIPTEPVRAGFIGGHNLEVVRQGMRQAVTAGSVRRLQSISVAAAGKTGTAQWSSKHKPHAWFTGFAPYKNPRIVITILLEEGGEGSETAVPVAEEFLQWYFGEYNKAVNGK